MILTKLILAIASFSLLYIFYQEEKKTLWYQIVVERPKFGFLIPVSFLLITLLLLFLINPFVFYFLLFLGLSVPFIYSAKKEEVNELAFLHFMLLFIYKYFFWFAIFISSFLFLFHLPVEAWIITFLQMEEGFSYSMLSLKGLFQEVSHAKGAAKIDKMIVANKQTTEVLHKESVNKIQPLIKELVGKTQAEPDKVKTGVKTAVQLHVAYSFDKLNFYKPKCSLDELLSRAGCDESTVALLRKHVSEKDLHALAEEWVVSGKFLKEHAFQNEEAISLFVKRHGNLGQDEVTRFSTDTIKHLVEGLMFANSNLSLTEILETGYMTDSKPKLAGHFRNSTYVEDSKGVVESCGQDIRVLLHSKNDPNASLGRPKEGTYDLQGSSFSLKGNFEVKAAVYQLTDSPQHIKNAKAVCSDVDECEKYLKNLTGKHSTVRVVFSSQHEAIPIIDITQAIVLTKHHNIGSSQEIVNIIHNSNPKAVASVENGRPVGYIFHGSPVESGVFIKK